MSVSDGLSPFSIKKEAVSLIASLVVKGFLFPF